MFNASRRLIVRTLLRPVNRELPVTTARAKELAAGREALNDPRDAAGKVMDSVVDRLLKELSW